MHLPDGLRPHLADPGFWARFFLGEEATVGDVHPFEDFAEQSIEFPVNAGHGLRLGLDVGIDMYTLSLIGGDELGWDDDAHWHPHVLRCAELDLLCRALAVMDPHAAHHPGLPLALLCRFAIVTTNTELEAIAPLLEAALRRLQAPFTVRDWLEIRDFRDADVIWRHDPQTDIWTVEQNSDQAPDLYSLRRPGNDEFPSTDLAALLAEARRVLDEAFAPWRDVPAVGDALAKEASAETVPDLAQALRQAGCDNPAILAALGAAEPAERCWAVEELAGLEPGALVRRHFGPSDLVAARTHRIDLEVDELGHHSRTIGIATDLNSELSTRELGSAELMGGTTARDASGWTVGQAAHLELLIRDDLDAALTVIRDVLTRHKALGDARLYRKGTQMPLT